MIYIDKLDVTGFVTFSPVALPLKIESTKPSAKLDLNFVRNKDKPEIVSTQSTRRQRRTRLDSD